MDHATVTKNNAVLILSCDKYSDLWEPFFELFFKHWPDCPYKIYLSSNKVPFKTKYPVENIMTHDDPDWSTSYRKILDRISEEYVLVLLEDIFITSGIETRQIENIFKFMKTTKAKHIHLRPLPQPDRLVDNNLKLGLYEKGCPYRVNAAGFWNKSDLYSLLIPGESPWNFEIMGSYRSSYSDGFYCLTKQLFTWVHVVDKGSWLQDAVAYCQKNNIIIDLSKRPILKISRKISTMMKIYYFDLIILVSWKTRLKILNFMRKVFVSY